MIHLTPEQQIFVTERHLATLTTLRPDGTPHVVPVGFTWDAEAGVVRVTTNDTSVKARNVLVAQENGAPGAAAVCQVDGGRWITLEGTMTLSRDPAEIADAVRRYTVRYRQPGENPRRVVLRLEVQRVMSSTYMAR
ncbi:MAG: pyridoxamine 5'-phosphate oxidase family protein [Cellulomonadaceae bacterium]